MSPVPEFFVFVFVFHFYLFIYLFLAVLGPRFCARAFSSCGKRGPLLIAVRGPLTIAAPPVAEHRLQTRRLSSCGSRAQLLCGMWDPPRPGLEPVSPALAGKPSTAAPPGKPLSQSFWSWCCSLPFSGPPGPKLSLLSILWFYHLRKSLYFVFQFDSLVLLIRLPSLLRISFSDPFVLWFSWYSLVYLLSYLPLFLNFSISIYPTQLLLLSKFWLFSVVIFLWT